KAQREAGSTTRAATLEACELRLRPIMMTSFAFILGVVPLMISAGAGAEMRQTLGTAVFSGMLGVTLFGIFLTPVFYYVIQWVSDRRGEPRREQDGDAEDRREQDTHGDEDAPSHDGDGHIHGAHAVPVHGEAVSANGHGRGNGHVEAH